MLAQVCGAHRREVTRKKGALVGTLEGAQQLQSSGIGKSWRAHGRKDEAESEKGLK